MGELELVEDKQAGLSGQDLSSSGRRMRRKGQEGGKDTRQIILGREWRRADARRFQGESVVEFEN